jgi:hypothetical protein
MKRLIADAISIGVIAAALCHSSASPLQHGDVPADLAWMVHLDCDNLRGTALGQSLLTELDKPELKEKLDGFQSMFTFDPRKQLHGLTLYNIGKATEDGVLLLYADFEAARLENLAKSAKDYKSASHNRHTIHSWVDEKKRASAKPRTYASIYRNRLIVFGQAESRVAAALDALDHSVPVLTPTNALVRFADGGNGSFLVATARKLDLSPSDPNAAAIFRSTKVFRLQLAESQRQLNGTMTLDTNDEEVAKTIASIGQGLIGLLKLQQEKTEAVKLAEALSLKQEGAGIVVNLSLPADDVTAFIKTRLKKEAEKTQKAEKAEKAEEEEKK